MIGENIRRIRAERNMTQVALADKSGVSVQMINQIEWGTKGLSVATLVRIAKALDCTTDKILEGEGNDGTFDKRTGS